MRPTKFGSQNGADPKKHPRWSEEEGRILSYPEITGVHSCLCAYGENDPRCCLNNRSTGKGMPCA